MEQQQELEHAKNVKTPQRQREGHDKALENLRHYQEEKQIRRQQVFGTGNLGARSERTIQRKAPQPEANCDGHLAQRLQTMSCMSRPRIVPAKLNVRPVGRTSTAHLEKHPGGAVKGN